MKMLAIATCLIISSAFIYAQDTTRARVDQTEMKQYYMVLLYRGDKWTPEQNDSTRMIQEGYMQNIRQLAQEGKLILAGPFLDNTDLRGLFLFDVDTMEEAKILCDSDPAVLAGRLRVEIKPSYGAKGIAVLSK